MGCASGVARLGCPRRRVWPSLGALCEPFVPHTPAGSPGSPSKPAVCEIPRLFSLRTLVSALVRPGSRPRRSDSGARARRRPAPVLCARISAGADVFNHSGTYVDLALRADPCQDWLHAPRWLMGMLALLILIGGARPPPIRWPDSWCRWLRCSSAAASWDSATWHRDSATCRRRPLKNQTAG